MRWLRLSIFLAVLLVLAVLPVQAHGYIVRALPANRAVLENPPARLQYWFSESLETRFSELRLRDANGIILLSAPADASTPTLLSLQIPPGLLEDGAYIVELQAAFSSDAHVAVESQVFYVGEAIAGVEGQARDESARPLEVIWKALLLSATFLLFGAFVLYAAVLVPAWGSAAHPAGLLPPRVMQRLNIIVWAGIILALVANGLALLQQTMIFFNVDAVTAMTGGLWQIVRGGSRAGDVWTLRMMLLILLIITHSASLYYREKFPGTVRAFWTANVWLMALLIGTQAVISHAAGSFVLPWLAMVMHWLHSLSVAFWVGGLIGLLLVLPAALQPYSGEDRRNALIPVMQRFSRFMSGMILLVMTTGLYNASNWFFTPADLATPYGASLAFKLLLLALLLPVAGLHHVVLRPALTVKLEKQLRRLLPNFLVRLYETLLHSAAYFSGTLRLEVLLAGVTLALAAILSATPVPEPEFARRETLLLTASQQVSGYDITLTLTPGAPGINTFDVVIQQNGANVVGADVQLQVVHPAQDVRSRWLPVDALDDGLYVAASEGIDASGIWWTLLDIRLAESDDLMRAFFPWHISGDAAVLQSQPPSLWTLLALAAVLATLLYLAYPALQQFSGTLKQYRTALLVGLGATVITTALLGFALWMVQEQQREIQAALMPPPTIINHVPPDAASLVRGAAIYAQVCADWETSSDFVVLVRSLPALRDEALYALPAAGWRSIPPCDRALTEQETWDVVNFLRTRRVS